MSQDRLDQNIRRYYRDQELDPAALARLKKTIDISEPRRSVRFGTRRWTSFAVAAAAVTLVAIGSILFLRQQDAQDSGQIVLEIAQQAALVHNQKLDMEFEADRYQDLRKTMRQLGFEPVEPARFGDMKMKIVGARYGSVHGQPAVQITLLDPTGELCTLYQLRPVGALAALSDTSRQIDGLTVDVWQEKGLLMVLARPAA